MDIKEMRRLALFPICLLLLAHDPSLEPFRGSFAAISNQLPDIKQSKNEKIIERDFKLSDPNYVVTRSVYAKRLSRSTASSSAWTFKRSSIGPYSKRVT